MVTLWFGISKEIMWLQKFANNFGIVKTWSFHGRIKGQRIIMDQLGQ
jgi:hypothetical protein